MIAVIAVAIGLALAPAALQTPRDPAVRPSSGTGSISGLVVTDGDAKPVRRAIVSLTGDELRPSRGAVTDDDGRFTFGHLPAGRLTLTVSRGAYITSVYGAKRPGRPGTPIVLRDGESIADLRVTIWHGAAISGIVRDGTGALARNVGVAAIPAHTDPSSGVFTLTNNGTTTNENGEYRIFGLEPGTYVVVARLYGTDGLLPKNEADVDAAFEAIRSHSRAVPVTTSPSAASVVPTQPYDYAPVYFPGTTSIAQATPITLSAGQDMGSVDFTLQRIVTSVVDGTVTRPDGQPAANAMVQIVTVLPPQPYAATTFWTAALTDANGRFRFARIAPGDYRLLARVPVQATAPFINPVISPPQGPLYWAEANVTAAGSDVRNLNLQAGAGVTVSGRVQAVAGSGAAPALTSIRLQLQEPPSGNVPVKTPIQATMESAPATAIGADGSFEVASQPPGTFLFVVSGLPAGWSALSVMSGDRDLLDGPITCAPGQRFANVVVTITNRPSQLTGTLQRSSGDPASNVFVIAYAADRKYWGPNSRRVKAVRPGTDGRYSIADLPAGDYLLAAVSDIDPDEWQDPAFLEQLVAASIKVTIAEGERRTQDLRIR